jgi:hypothetical protein
MIIENRPVVQTYAEIKYIKLGQYVQTRELDRMVQIAREVIEEMIGYREDVTGRSTYSICSRGNIVKIFVEQYMNTLGSFEAEPVIQEAFRRIQAVPEFNSELMLIEEYENLNDGIITTCPTCDGKGLHQRLDLDDCPQCKGYGYCKWEAPNHKIIPLIQERVS